ncbi:Protein P [Folsomia candida]|uniref:Protein P n=1 Tax=Folsomia candida TaxID=158441 RepID=A0A226DIY8_FOLCA|nr:Protein P [Folsomia candida]
MESVKTAMTMVSKNCFMAVIDLKDAYHAIPVHESCQKYLKFRWKEVLYKYRCIPFGLCLAPWLYTKLNKPVVSYLRSLGVLLVSYLDDTLIIGRTEAECKKSLKLALDLFSRLGLVVNMEKSQLIPSKQVRFLGFILNSEIMRMLLPVDKFHKIISKCRMVLDANVSLIRVVAELVGILVAASPATRYGMLYTRQLEIEKTAALIRSSGKYTGNIVISSVARMDIKWWTDNINSEFRPLCQPNPTKVIFSDSSPLGWGAVCGDKEARGNFSPEDQLLHINVLELMAVFYGINSFAKDAFNEYIQLRVDSSTAMAYVNNFGGCRSQDLHNIAKNIWVWCQERNIILHATYINTQHNVDADRLSRMKVDVSDFSLTKSYFQTICSKFYRPDIDLFATYQTTQFDR